MTLNSPCDYGTWQIFLMPKISRQHLALKTFEVDTAADSHGAAIAAGGEHERSRSGRRSVVPAPRALRSVVGALVRHVLRRVVTPGAVR